jgi:hypothetical protein
MTNYELKYIDTLDIIDFIKKVEFSYNIKYADEDFSNVKTVGELCSIIVNKIELENLKDCTSQQAFYKLRNAISDVCQVDKKEIHPTSYLSQFINNKKYRPTIKSIENKLGFELNLFTYYSSITFIFLITFIISLFLGYFDWKLGLGGIAISLIGSWVSYKFTNKLSVDTVGDVVKLMIREKYIKSRRNSNTVNKTELEKILNNWLLEECG